eukprot:2630003-Rhodomonas_salina.2
MACGRHLLSPERDVGAGGGGQHGSWLPSGVLSPGDPSPEAALDRPRESKRGDGERGDEESARDGDWRLWVRTRIGGGAADANGPRRFLARLAGCQLERFEATPRTGLVEIGIEPWRELCGARQARQRPSPVRHAPSPVRCEGDPDQRHHQSLAAVQRRRHTGIHVLRRAHALVSATWRG